VPVPFSCPFILPGPSRIRSSGRENATIK